MPCWIAVKQHALARHKGVHVLLDISVPGPNNWALAVTYKNRIYASRAALSAAEVEQQEEEQCTLPGPEGDTGWRAVLARLLGAPEKPGEWDGSALQRASYFFEVGTWNWFAMLADIRRGVKHEVGSR